MSYSNLPNPAHLLWVGAIFGILCGAALWGAGSYIYNHVDLNVSVQWGESDEH